jgi:hypothetical protein
MLDYADWVRRAVAFTESLRNLPGKVRAEVKVAPPLTEDAIANLTKSCRLPIPDSLRRFWREASGHCRCTYHWAVPEQFHPQKVVAFPSWSSSNIAGGAEFDSAEYTVELANDLVHWESDTDFPADARFWSNSLPLIPVGDGDYAGLYVHDDPVNPPVVYLCHDGCGASHVIAPDLDTFLTLWERLGYIGLYVVHSFFNRRTGLIDPDALPAETEALTCLLRGDARPDLKPTPSTMNAAEWDVCADPHRMLEWLEANNRLDESTVRRLACTFCRRIWDRLGEWDRKAIDTAERFAEGTADEAELRAARASLLGGMASIGTLDDSPEREIPRFMDALNESVTFAKSQGPMHYAAIAAIDGDWMVSWQITQHLDEPELSREKQAHADLIRRYFGNPFR